MANSSSVYTAFSTKGLFAVTFPSITTTDNENQQNLISTAFNIYTKLHHPLTEMQ